MRDMNAVPFDGPLRDALRDRVARDSIRCVHLRGWDTNLLRSVVSSLTLDDEDVRNSSIQSLILEQANLDIPTFIARHRFPKLRNLRLYTKARIPSWDLLKLQSTSLTTLSLEFEAMAQSSPTTPQLLSILSSYQNLQDLSLSEAMIPDDAHDKSTFRMPLRHLTKLHLVGDCCRIFRLLHRLEYPDTLERVSLELLDCAADRVLESLAPYLQERIRRDSRFQGRLGIRVSSRSNFITFKIDVIHEFGVPTMLLKYDHPYMSFTALFEGPVPQGAEEKLCTNLIALTPREHVVGLAWELSIQAMRDLATTMPNIEDLYLMGSVVSDPFLQPDPPSHAKLFSSLRRLCLGYFNLQNDGDWSPLIDYLIHQTSGGQAISLRLCRGHVPVPPGVIREMEGLVKEFNLGYPNT